MIDRFEIFKEACGLMDHDDYYEAYLKLSELTDYCLSKNGKKLRDEMNELLKPVGLRI